MYSGDVAEAHVPGALPGLVLPSTGPVTTVDTATTAGTGTAAAVTELITGPAAADADTAATTAAAGTTPPPSPRSPRGSRVIKPITGKPAHVTSRLCRALLLPPTVEEVPTGEDEKGGTAAGAGP